jgi:hypothetical protein
MSMEAFCVPLPGRCLSPLPEKERAFKKGGLVAWTDGELGVVSDASDHSVSVLWQESPWSVYPRHGGAIDRITVLETEAV